METLTLRRNVRLPHFGIWKWAEADFSTPLTLTIDNAKVNIYIRRDLYSQKDLAIYLQGHIEISFSPPPQTVLSALKSKGPRATEFALELYEIFRRAMEQFESLLMSAGNVKYLLPYVTLDIHEFFNTRPLRRGDEVSWKIGNSSPSIFTPNIPKTTKRHPLYTKPQLITGERWKRVQAAADNMAIPTGELLELYRLRSKVGWRQSKVATIEASIVSESLLREYGLQILKKNGFSKNKIKKLKDELSFNNLLNIVLPLSLSKQELRRISAEIQAVDVLRGIRNDLIHGNLLQKDIDETNVLAGIEAAIKLAEFLKKKIVNDV